MESALRQGQDELCQLAASKDALQKAHTKLAAAYTALQDQVLPALRSSCNPHLHFRLFPS